MGKGTGSFWEGRADAIMYMDIAKTLSYYSKCNERKVGAILVYTGNKSGVPHLVADGINGTKPGEPNGDIDPIHAERNCINKALDQNIDLKNCTLFVSCRPCATCTDMILQLCISEVIYLDSQPIMDHLDDLREAGCKVNQLNTLINF